MTGDDTERIQGIERPQTIGRFRCPTCNTEPDEAEVVTQGTVQGPDGQPMTLGRGEVAVRLRPCAHDFYGEQARGIADRIGVSDERKAIGGEMGR